jgi:hypothetical protein
MNQGKPDAFTVEIQHRNYGVAEVIQAFKHRRLASITWNRTRITAFRNISGAKF